MANTIQAVVYTSDTTHDYVTGADSEVFAQVGASTQPKIGGADYDGSPALDPLPNGRPRQVYMQSPGKKSRYVVCLTPDSDLYTGVETTLTLEDSDGASATYTRKGVLSEKFRRRNP